MIFFTPDLYRRFNSPDDAIADLADGDWEDAIRAYAESLSPHLEAMNPRVRQLAEGREGFCLHDAELLSIQRVVPDAPSVAVPLPPVAMIALADEHMITELVYFLRAPVEQTPPPADWPFSASRAHWLFDEIHVDSDPHLPQPIRYRHEILLSDGSTMSIPFSDVLIHCSSLQESQSVATVSRRT